MPSPPAKPNRPSLAAGFSADELANVDEGYLFFLQHAHIDGDAYTLVIPPKDGSSAPPEIIRYEHPVPDDNAGAPDAPPSDKNSSEAAPHGVKHKAPDASPAGEVVCGGAGAAVPMEEDTPALTLTPVAVAEPVWTGNCPVTVGDHGDAEEDDDTEEEDEEEEDDGEEEDGSLPALGQSGEDGVGTEDAIPASETHVEEEEMEKVKGAGKNTLNALATGATHLDPLDTKEASSSKGHLAICMPLNASELQGVIWPPHINDRPNSVFKEKLIEFLIKPLFTQEEYESYYALATKRTPMVRERRTRNNVAYYDWKHAMSKSYFDWYPDLAEQFNLQGNNYPNALALLRGLFFWLQNIELEGQFMPWSNEFKKYRVVVILE